MVLISEDLIRKRSEHNEGEISTLEELSLHQQDIEKIEYIDKWCRDLKILLLQSNLIPKIENIGRLKQLEYLNLALNNIERVENLEGCESLKKLDLTVNFVGELTSIECLRDLYHFEELYLTGNPCVQYEGYREYVIATLRNLKHLDGCEVEKSERIKAVQEYTQIKQKILKQQEIHRRKRENEKQEAERDKKRKKERDEKKAGFDGRWYTDINDGDGDIKTREAKAIEKEKEFEKKDNEFWDEKVAFTPESRVDVHKHMKEKRQREQGGSNKKPKKERRFQMEDGRMLNMNDGKIDFTLTDDEQNNKILLDLCVYKYLETSLIDVDVQTNYVRVTMKGNVFQLALDEEVLPDSSSAQRSQITGNLLITMPKVNPIIRPQANKSTQKDKKETMRSSENRTLLEVDPSTKSSPDFGNIVRDLKTCAAPLGGKVTSSNQIPERQNSEDFEDDPDVPPLM